jgi:hypothetical protein
MYTINCEFGFLILTIIPLLQEYFKKYNTPVTIQTNTFFLEILNKYFGKDLIIGFNCKDSINPRRSQLYNTSTSIMNLFVTNSIISKDYSIGMVLPYKIDHKIYTNGNINNKNIICIFPSVREGWTKQHRLFSENFYNYLIKNIESNTKYSVKILGRYEIYKNLHAEYVENLDDQITCLNNCKYLISPHSGYIDFGICCDIDNAIVLWKPFGKACSGKDSHLNPTDHYKHILKNDINKVNIYEIINSNDENVILKNILSIIN